MAAGGQTGIQAASARTLNLWRPVTSPVPLDSGPGSLRQAIIDTAAGGTVDFQADLTGTITLTSGELAINKDLTIAGPGPSVITVSGNHASRVFNIGATFTVYLSRLTVANGLVTLTTGLIGGGIMNAGTLALTDCTLRDNQCIHGGGGGISSRGTLTLTGCTLIRNSAVPQTPGGGISVDGGTVTITGCTFSDNTAIGGGGFGGAIFISGSGNGTTNCTISGNSTAGYGGGIGALAGANAQVRNTVVA
jgi:predicted outer membrane repeat protein